MARVARGRDTSSAAFRPSVRRVGVWADPASCLSRPLPVAVGPMCLRLASRRLGLIRAAAPVAGPQTVSRREGSTRASSIWPPAPRRPSPRHAGLDPPRSGLPWRALSPLRWTAPRGVLATWPRFLHASPRAADADASADAGAADADSNPARPPPYRILFFGSDAFSVASLRHLIAAGSDIVAHIEVVTAPDHRRRPTPVKQYARAQGLAVHDAPKASLKGWTLPPPPPPPPLPGSDAEGDAPAWDVAVVVSFGAFLPPALIAQFGVAALNVHPSLLPLYRGAAPIQHALLRGDPVTGVSVITLSPTAFDMGHLVAQQTTPLAPDPDDAAARAAPPPAPATFPALAARLAEQGAALLVETLRHLPARLRAACPQDASPHGAVIARLLARHRGGGDPRAADTPPARAPLAPPYPRASKLTASDACVDWHRMTAADVVRLAGALMPRFAPLATLDGRALRLLAVADAGAAAAAGRPDDPPPGTAWTSDGQRLYVAAAAGTCIRVERLQFAHSRPLPAPDFINGYLSAQPLRRLGNGRPDG